MNIVRPSPDRPTQSVFGRCRQLLRLALADLRRDGLLSACSILMLAASLSPLLTLFGLENGVIGTLIERQDKDPAMRLIVPEVSGGQRFDSAWFAQTASWSEVAFVLPNTRAIAGLIDLVALPAQPADASTPTNEAPVRISLLPTAAGDPVTAGLPVSDGSDWIVLSSAAARKLNRQAGASVRAVIERVRDGRSEPAATVLRVAAVLPIERYSGDVGFVSLSLVEAVQAYRDGYAVTAQGWIGDTAAPTVDAHPLFRMYARSIRDVAALAARLRSMGLSVFTRDSEIASTLGLQRNLFAVLLIVSSLAAFGFVVAMIALQIATVRRKRREFAILQLIGYGPHWLMALACLESLLLAVTGTTVAFGLYALAGLVIDLFFAQYLAGTESACRLSATQAGALAGLTIAVSMLPALLAGISVAAIDPGDELRDV